MPRTLIAAAALGVVLVGCTGGPARTTASPAPATRSSVASPRATPADRPARPVTLAGANACPVTIGHPVPRTVPWRDELFGWASAYGNGSLWVGSLWPHGVVFITPDNVNPDGSLGMKFGWYRLTSGFITITGRRLDAAAPAASGQASGYGLTGFAASGVIFPTEGCWQITGRVGRVSLTFVTFVIRGRCDLNAVPIGCVADHARSGRHRPGSGVVPASLLELLLSQRVRPPPRPARPTAAPRSADRPAAAATSSWSG